MIPVAEPSIGDEEIKNVLECVRSGWVSSIGSFVKKFEEDFAQFCNVQYATTTSNGTAALHLALAALDIGPGDEVIIPSFTFIATANAVKYVGATPVFVDVEKRTGNIDITKIAPCITSRTKAIIPVHLYGHPCDMDPILALAEKHNLYIIEDCAEALGAEYKGKKVGSFGHINCFSFYGNKIITTGEGGMCTTNDPALFDKMTLLKNHGMRPSKRYWHEVVGFNYRMTNLQAALGVAQLARCAEFVEKKRENARLYTEKLQGTPGITLPAEEDYAKNVYWMFNIFIQPSLGVDKEELRKRLGEKEIGTRPLFYPMTAMPMYKQDGFPVSAELSSTGISLPSSTTLKEQDIDTIVAAIKASVQQ